MTAGLREVPQPERRFRVHGLFRLPDPAGVDGIHAVRDGGERLLEATYHDTEDLRLAREGLTLRRRTGGGEGWSLKVPVLKAKSGERDELVVPLDDGSPDQAPAELVGLVRAVVRDRPVTPVATLRTRRRVQLLLDGGGQPLGELLDDTVSVVDADGHVAARFRELELAEAPGVTWEALTGLVQALTAAGAVTGEFVSKAARALGPLAAAPPEVPEPPPVGPAEPAREAVAAHLARHTRALRVADIAVRRDADDAVHQMRVAARRLRSGLRVFRPLLDREWADALRDELAWVAAGLSDYRDREVLLARLESHAGELPPEVAADEVRALLRRRLGREMAEARRHALEMLESPRYLAVHDALVAACADPLTTEGARQPAGQALPPLVAEAWKKLARSAARLLADEAAVPGGAPDDEWHEARKIAKRARYAAEACAPVLGSGAEALARQLARVTEALGDHQDGAIAADTVRSMAGTGRVSPRVAFALGVLHGVEREHVRRSRVEFAGLWPEVSRRRWRRWLGS